MSRNLMKKKQITLPACKKCWQEPYYPEECESKKFPRNFVFQRRASNQDISNSNLEKNAKYRMKQKQITLPTNKRVCHEPYYPEEFKSKKFPRNFVFQRRASNQDISNSNLEQNTMYRMKEKQITLPANKRVCQEPYYPEECESKKFPNNFVFQRASNQDISDSNLEQNAYSHTQLSTNAGENCSDLRAILDQKKRAGMTSATARKNMDVSASVAVPAETNNMYLLSNDETPPEIFLHQTSQRMDTLEAKVKGKHFKMLSEIIFKATALSMHIKEKTAGEDLKEDTLEVTEKDYNTWSEIAYAATVLSMYMKQKMTDKDLKRDANTPTFIPGLTLIEQSPSTTKSDFVQEVKDICQEEAKDMVLNKNNEPSVDLYNENPSS